MTTQLTISLGEKIIVVQCDKTLRLQAEWLLKLLRDTFGRDGEKVQDGFRLQVGWSILSLRNHNGKFVVHEPNYGGDPFTEWNDDISCTLLVQAEQNDFLKLAGVEDGIPALFQDKVVFLKGSLEEKRIYLERVKDSPHGDSGWYIGPVNDEGQQPTSESLEAIFVYDLLKIRPAIVQVLALPPGFIVVFDGDNVEGWEADE